MTDHLEPCCPPGCSKYSGGETKHIKECPFYPGSFTEMYDKLAVSEAALREEVERLRQALEKISSPSQTQKLLWWQIEAREALK